MTYGRDDRIMRTREMAAMFQRAHVYAMQRAIPERIVVSGDTVTTTWASWMDAHMRDCEKVHNAWLVVVHALATFDDVALEAALRAFDELVHSLIPPVTP